MRHKHLCASWEPIIRLIGAQRGLRAVLASKDCRRPSIIVGLGTPAAVAFCERAAHSE